MELPLRTKLLYATSNIGNEALARSRSLWLIYFFAPPRISCGRSNSCSRSPARRAPAGWSASDCSFTTIWAAGESCRRATQSQAS